MLPEEGEGGAARGGRPSHALKPEVAVYMSEAGRRSFLSLEEKRKLLGLLLREAAGRPAPTARASV